jgi:MFS family permease
MAGFAQLLRQNPNYRYTWFGQIVSEVGDHFNNIAVFSLAMHATSSGMVVTGVMLARALPAVGMGPVAGVLLDRLDRKHVMIASDVVRAVIALGFILCLGRGDTWLLYLLSALLMGASPFFTSGRAAILPAIASDEELHTANSITQTTQWTTTAIGAFLGGASVAHFGYHVAFIFNALSFVFSALCISRLRAQRGSGFRPERKDLSEDRVVRPWHEYREGLRYMKRNPLLLGLALVGVGWATGGGAAQILFSLFGETVFQRGAAGIGQIWGAAGLGLVAGGVFAHWLGKRISFGQYKMTVSICYLVHGSAYVIFSQMQSYALALVFIGLSRAAVAVSSVLNFSELLKHVADEYRGRVFSTMESIVWSTMMLSMMGAGIASEHYSPRTIGAVSGVLSSSTALFWAWANMTGRLPEPARSGVDPEEIEVHGDPVT